MAQADYACASFVCDTNENWNQNGENMQGIKILCVGKVKEKYFRDGIECYVRQVRRKYLMEIVECDDEPTPEGASAVMERQIREKKGTGCCRKYRRATMSSLSVLMENIILLTSGGSGCKSARTVFPVRWFLLSEVLWAFRMP